MKKLYKIPYKYFENICSTQKSEMLKDFQLDKDGIIIPYTHKGYKCNTKDVVYNNNIKALSMFSGAGGLDIGTQLANIKVLSSMDINSDSVETLKCNKFFKNTEHNIADITQITGKFYEKLLKKENPEKLIVIGGPPCQPFSKAGYWITNEKRNSFNDPRNMIGPYFKILSEIRPDGFVLENVESILHPSNKRALEEIYESMTKLGYNYSMLKLNAIEYGIPQRRKRVFFLASKKKINATIIKTHGSQEECEKNRNLLPYERTVDWIAKYDDGDNNDLNIEGKWQYELTCVPFGKNYIALSSRENYPTPIFEAGKRYWSSLLKLHPFLPSWTIIASPGHWEGPFHWKNRKLNIRELASIQTFPEDYVFYGSYNSQRKQIGNAVPPLLAKQIIEELCKWL